MRNTFVANVIKNANKSKPISEHTLVLRKNYIDLAIKHVSEIAKQYSITNSEELKQIVINIIFKQMQEFSEVAHVEGKYFQIEAADAILADKSIIETNYARIKNDPSYLPDITNYNGTIYTTHFNSSCRTLIGEAIVLVQELEKSMSPELRKIAEQYNSSSEKDKKKIEQKYKHHPIFSPDTIKLYSKVVNRNEIDKIYEMIKLTCTMGKESLKDQEIQTLEFLFERFEEYGFLERYKKDNDFNMANCGLKDYTYEISTGNYSKNQIGIKEMFSRKFLETLDLEDITMLSTFWQNRYSKECSSIGEAIFCIDTLGLWDQILDNPSEITISDDDIKALDKKIQCVKKISYSILSNLQGKHKATSKKNEEIGFKVVSTNTEVDKIHSQEGETYRKLFSEILPNSPNMLNEDIDTYKLMLNQSENIYLVRNNILLCKIRSLINSKKCKNWGIILEEEQINPENYSSNFVLIGMDHEGFNMPIRFHIKKDLLESLLRSYNGQTILPIYEGNKDFIVNGETFPTNILMPSNPRLKRVISQPSPSQEQTRFRSHLAFIYDSDKYPDHLKETIQTSKGPKKVRPQKRYIDLTTNNILILQDGKFTNIDESTGGNKGDGR